MSWFSGKDDKRYEALRDSGERAFNKSDTAKGNRMHDKADELRKNGDVSKKTRSVW